MAAGGWRSGQRGSSRAQQMGPESSAELSTGQLQEEENRLRLSERKRVPALVPLADARGEQDLSLASVLGQTCHNMWQCVGSVCLAGQCPQFLGAGCVVQLYPLLLRGPGGFPWLSCGQRGLSRPTRGPPIPGKGRGGHSSWSAAQRCADLPCPNS